MTPRQRHRGHRGRAIGARWCGGPLELGLDAHVRGATVEEIEGFPAFAVDLAPDVVFLDQNLDHPLHRTPLVEGTEIVARLRQLGYAGKIVMKSASNAPDHGSLYLACGADGAVSRGSK